MGSCSSHALDYAARRWPVFPVAGILGPGRCSCRSGPSCPHPGKHPLTRHGLQEASCDPERIRSWWCSWPAANVAVATGARAGLVVVDIDPPKGGAESAAALEGRGLVLPETLTARTGGGGRHLFYRPPAGQAVRNRAGGLPGGGGLAGIDLRGDGGYVVAAPSAHASGDTYQWADPLAPVAPWPRWMHERRRLAPDGPTRRLRPARGGTGPAPRAAGGGSRYGFAALERETAAVRTAEIGGRNERLNRAAWSVGMLVGGGELEDDVAEAELRAAALTAGLDEHEATATIRSGLDAGRQKPRRRPAAR